MIFRPTVQHRVAVVIGSGAGGSPVADRDQDAAAGILDRPRRSPDAGLAAGRHGEVPQGRRGRRVQVQADHAASIAAAVTGQAAVGHVHPAAETSKAPRCCMAAGLMPGTDAGTSTLRDHFTAPVTGSSPSPCVEWAIEQRDHDDRLGGGVVGRGAGYAGRVDVAAGQRRSGDWCAQVLAPHHGIADESVDRVVLGGDDLDAVVHDDRLAVHRTVERDGPHRFGCPDQLLDRDRVAGPRNATVIGRPVCVGRCRRLGRRRSGRRRLGRRRFGRRGSGRRGLRPQPGEPRPERRWDWLDSPGHWRPPRPARRPALLTPRI